LTESLILHAAAQSAFAREQAARSPSAKGQHHRIADIRGCAVSSLRKRHGAPRSAHFLNFNITTSDGPRANLPLLNQAQFIWLRLG